jgi:thiol-disulfide isomerase/thioredoxin
LGACAKDASDAKETADSAQPEAVAQGHDQVAESNSPSAQAYAQLQEEVLEIQKTATTQAKMAEAIAQIAEKFKGFLKEYPDSDEANDATLQLGMLYTVSMELDKATPYLEDYIRRADEDDENVGFAHFYLAEAYKKQERFDDAKSHYKIFLDKYSNLNPKYTSSANSSLDDLQVLRRLSVGNEPIPFDVKAIDGKTISLANYKGKVVLLDFWATWCMPCKVEMPNVIRIHKKYNKQGFEIIGISLDRDRNALEKYVKDNEMNWPQYFDGQGWNSGLASKYRVREIPTTYLIDKKGKIRYRSLRGKQLEEAVKKLVNET